MNLQRTITQLTCAIAITMFMLSCGSAKGSKDEISKDYPKAFLSGDLKPYMDGANANISAVAIEKNLMSLSVSYSGGCEEHDFQLVGFDQLSNGKELQRHIILHHNSNGDACREFIQDTLYFDIKVLGDSKGSEVKLVLEGYDQAIPYTLQ